MSVDSPMLVPAAVVAKPVGRGENQGEKPKESKRVLFSIDHPVPDRFGVS
jgi:hypothetical protein